MKRSRLKSVLAVVLGTAIVAVVSGCDAKENADLANGREIFVASCGTCHTMKEAGTSADIGPDLDASFAAARAAGMDQDTIEGVVQAQVEEPRVTDVEDPTYMPPKIVEGQELEDVAAYVASVAGVPGIEPPIAEGGPGGQIFADNGCAACHTLGTSKSVGNVGPNLDNELPGQTPDEIRQSIVDPEAEIVSGFSGGIMPQNYGESIAPKDLDILVNYLYSCAGIKADDNQEFEDDGTCVGGAQPPGGKGK